MPPYRILIVGSGPSACYVVDYLLKAPPSFRIDVIDSLPHPFGLLRTGVAPDHDKIKSLQAYFHSILDHESVHFYGNVSFGTDITLENVEHIYDAIFFCTGTAKDYTIPHLDYTCNNVFGSRRIVEWYNGYTPPLLSFDPKTLGNHVCIIGLGNVALDLARVLLKDPSALAETEIPPSCIDHLTQNPIEQVSIMARRGPAQAKCTPLELAELCELPNTAVSIHAPYDLSNLDLIEISKCKRIQKNINLFDSMKKKKKGHKQLHLYFNTQCTGTLSNANKMTGVKFSHTKLKGPVHHQQATLTSSSIILHPTSVISSTGYRGIAIKGIPFNTSSHCIPHTAGKVHPQPSSHTQCYCCGWIKRGPQGVIGTNKRDAKETVDTYLSSLDSTPPKDCANNSLDELLSQQNNHITFNDWKQINEYEIINGKTLDKPRLKVTSMEAIQALLKKSN